MSASTAPVSLPTTEAERDAQLAAITERVRTLGFGLVRVMTRLTGERLTSEDFMHHARVAVWEAYIAASGFDPAFDIAANAEALEKVALKELRNALVGRDTTFGDTALRLRNRKNRAMVNRYTWSAWQFHATTEPADQSRGGAANRHTVIDEYLERSEQEERLREKAMLELEAALREILSPREFKWLVERECRNVPQATHIEELLAEDAQSDNPRYQGDNGWANAENRINVTVHRAKKKAAKALGETWAALSREAVE